MASNLEIDAASRMAREVLEGKFMYAGRSVFCRNLGWQAYDGTSWKRTCEDRVLISVTDWVLDEVARGALPVRYADVESLRRLFLKARKLVTLQTVDCKCANCARYNKRMRARSGVS